MNTVTQNQEKRKCYNLSAPPPPISISLSPPNPLHPSVSHLSLTPSLLSPFPGFVYKNDACRQLHGLDLGYISASESATQTTIIGTFFKVFILRCKPTYMSRLFKNTMPCHRFVNICFESSFMCWCVGVFSLLLSIIAVLLSPTEGRPEMSIVILRYGSSGGVSWAPPPPTHPHPRYILLFFYLSHLLFRSCPFGANGSFSRPFFPTENSPVFFVKRVCLFVCLFVCCCLVALVHWYLPLCIRIVFLHCFRPFFCYTCL